MCCTKRQYEANIGMVTINTANPNRDGTGSMGTVITGASDGSVISAITIKAQSTTTQGMVRLFIDNGAGTIIMIREVSIPATTPTSIVPTFGISLASTINLEAGFMLKASTQNAETFNVIAYAQDWTNCSC